MDNGQWTMDNDCIAFGDGFKNISEGNTKIVNCQFSIFHYYFSVL